MAKSKQPPVIPPSVSPEQGITLLTLQKTKAEGLLNARPIPEDKFDAWCNTLHQFLIKIFGSESNNLSAPSYGTPIMMSGSDESYYEAERAESLQRNLTIIDSFIEQLEAEVQMRLPAPALGEARGEAKEVTVFIGHGRSKLWARLKIFLEEELSLKTVSYESESRVGDSIIPILEKMLAQSTFAILILTAEDETAQGQLRARQNVVHEVGLFQGRLGFKKAVILLQRGVDQFTNVDGLQYVPFTGENIEESFYELGRCLKAQGQLK